MIQMDVRRFWRSVLDLAHARRDALSLSGRRSDKRDRTSCGKRGISPPGDDGNRGNRGGGYGMEEAIEMHKRFSFNKIPPL